MRSGSGFSLLLSPFWRALTGLSAKTGRKLLVESQDGAVNDLNWPHAKGGRTLRKGVSLPSKKGRRDKTPTPKTIRGRELNPNIFFSNFSGASGISRQNPGISRQKSLIPWVSRDIPNFLAPTPSRARPPPHRKISGPKSLGLGSFFVPGASVDFTTDPRPLYYKTPPCVFYHKNVRSKAVSVLSKSALRKTGRFTK